MFEKLKKKITIKYDKSLENEFLSEALEIIEKPASPIGHLMIWIIVAIIITTIIWSCFGKMDEVAIGLARVMPKDGVQVIQPLYEGTITEILVSEGEQVRAGQELIVLDTSTLNIQTENSKSKVKELILQNNLINLLLEGVDITNYAEKNNVTSENELQVVNLMISMQEENKLTISDGELQYEQNKKQLEIEKNTLKKYNESLVSLENQLEQEKFLYSGKSPENKILDNYELQLSNSQKELTEYEYLFEIGAIAKYQLTEKQNEFNVLTEQYELQKVLAEHETVGNSTKISDLNRQSDTLKMDISSAEQAVKKQEELLLQAETAIKSEKMNFEKNLTNTAVNNSKTIMDYNSDLKIKSETEKSQILTSPTDGTVQTLAVKTIGGVVTSAQPVITIVPNDAELIIEADVLNRDIGYIFVGQEVSVKLDTFSFQKYGAINGKIIYVSPSAVEDERQGPIYKIKIAFDKKSFDINGNQVPVLSGMTGTAEIKLEERKIIEFFLEPNFEYFDTSLKVR